MRDDMWKFIEERYASKARQRLAKEKEVLNTKGSLDWNSFKGEIAKLDSLLVADFWDWYGIARHYEELFVENQASFTTKSKEKTISVLSQRTDLNVYSSKHSSSNGLNIYIGRK